MTNTVQCPDCHKWFEVEYGETEAECPVCGCFFEVE